MTIHLVKLVVGVQDLQSYYDIQRHQIFDYHGSLATPCWTRYKPKAADEILEKGGSIYRVMQGRIMCRHKILGFEIVDDTPKGKMCMIVQDAQIIETVHKPKRPFQGWRYLKPSDIPADRGVYEGLDENRPPPELEADLREAGLL
ncbi:MAG: DUF1489 family protein [Alphaproteobacteria bacterium]|nr:DUF1489 family protein [Alphaproteobacteria bacterium]